jgi:uncharacterized membrane protein
MRKINQPLSSSYMLVSLMGFIFSAFMLDIFPSWAFAFMIVFLVMFVSSVVSMSNLPFEYPDILDELRIHDPLHYHKRRVKSKSVSKSKSTVKKPAKKITGNSNKSSRRKSSKK